MCKRVKISIQCDESEEKAIFKSDIGIRKILVLGCEQTAFGNNNRNNQTENAIKLLVQS